MNGYSDGKPKKQVHWAWSVFGLVLAMLVLAWAGAWIGEALA